MHSNSRFSISRGTLFALALLVGVEFHGSPGQAQQNGGIVCPQPGSEAPASLISSSDAEMRLKDNGVDLANDVTSDIYRIRSRSPNISYDELTDTLIAAYCPVIANAKGLTDNQKWDRFRLFDKLVQQMVAANAMMGDTRIIANIPLPPAIFDRLAQAAREKGETPATYMGALLVQAAGK